MVNYPTSLDDGTLWDVEDHITDVLAKHHNDPNDAIIALETKVGIDNSAVVTTHEYKINTHLVDTGNPHSVVWADVSSGHTAATHSAMSATMLSDIDSVGSKDIITDGERTGLHAESHTLTSHSTRAHSELSSAPVDAHHDEIHIIENTGPHTGTCTSGQVLKGTGSNVFSFGQLAHSQLNDDESTQHLVLPNTMVNVLSSYAHGDLSDAPIDAHHDEDHVADSSGPHTGSSLTIGHVLRVSGAAAFSFAQLAHGDLSGIGSNAHSVIDTHLGSTSNPHSVDWADVSSGHDGTAHNSINVTDLGDVTGAGSGIIISNAERTGLHTEGHQLGVSGGVHTGTLPLTDLIEGASGDIIYRGAVDWQVLTKGSDTDVLTLASGVPSWAEQGAPGAHASSHEVGGGDLVDHDLLTNFTANEHFLQSAITTVGALASGSIAAGFDTIPVARTAAKCVAVWPDSYITNQNLRTTDDVSFNTVNGMTDAEMSQIENIGTVTISAAQWGILGNLAATLTAAELNYSDGVTSLLQTQLDELRKDCLIGVANSDWIPCVLEGTGTGTVTHICWAGLVRNTGSADMSLSWKLPLRTRIRTASKLYVRGVSIEIYDADGNDYISLVRIYELDAFSQTQVWTSGAVTLNSQRTYVEFFDAVDVSDSQTVGVHLNCVNTDADHLQIYGVLVNCYYA